MIERERARLAAQWVLGMTIDPPKALATREELARHVLGLAAEVERLEEALDGERTAYRGPRD